MKVSFLKHLALKFPEVSVNCLFPLWFVEYEFSTYYC